MEKQEFKIVIDAPRDLVWSTLWNDESYRTWTSVFSEGSQAQTDWEKGSRVLFTDGSGEGMVATIAENIPFEYMSIQHLGIVKNGVEVLDSAEAKSWAGAFENYTLKTIDGKTELLIDIDVADDFKDYFLNTWPKALDKVKELAEKEATLPAN